MVVISRPVIRDFIERHPVSANSLNEWYGKTIESDWSKLNDVKQSWNSCDFIGNDRYVFNIAGNHYRLIAVIHFKKRTLYIRGVFTHTEYSELSKRGELTHL
jgi:mRNA interferase HigB